MYLILLNTPFYLRFQPGVAGLPLCSCFLSGCEHISHAFKGAQGSATPVIKGFALTARALQNSGSYPGAI
jgi:hypothetical protein